MDKRIFGSILTILILLGVLWVFAQTITTGTLTAVNGTGSKNFTASHEWCTAAKFCNVTLNMTLVLGFTKYNISNISIRVPSGYEGQFELGFPLGTNITTKEASGESDDINVTHKGTGYSCNKKGNDVIECVNQTGTNNLEGNSTVYIAFEAFGNWSQGSKGEEAFKNWRITVTTNKTLGVAVSATKNVAFGVDDLRPRISSINISDGTYTRTGKDRTFNQSSKGASLLNNSDINVTIVVNERNRGNIWMFWGRWDGNKTAVAGAKYVGTNWSTAFRSSGRQEYRNMTKNSGCNDPAYGGTTQTSCWYSAVIENTNGVNFSDGVLYTVMFWANESLNHEANFTNGLGGFNFTIDGDNPSATITMPTITNVYSGRSITFKCDTSDNDGYADLGEIIITSPSGRETSKTVDNNNKEATFSGINELGEAGLYKVKCKASDLMGHTGESEEQEFRVMARSVATAGEKPAAPVAKVDISSTETPSGSISGIQGESDTFTINSATAHRLTFLEVGKDYAKIKIESTPIELTLKVGESKELEIDGQTVKVTLSSIVNGKASVSITNVAKYEEKIAEEKAAREEAAVTEEKGYGLWVTLLVIVVLIVIGYLVLKSRKGKKGEIHFTRQDLGL